MIALRDEEKTELMEPLSEAEQKELAKYEDSIEKFRKAYFAVGQALSAIRDKRLYRQTHGTFEDYCRDRLGFTKTHANRLIDGASVRADLTPIGVTIKNLEQTRPLARLDTEQRQEAWKRAQEISGDKEPTGVEISQAADEVAPKPVRPSIVRGLEREKRREKAREKRERKASEARERKAEENGKSQGNLADYLDCGQTRFRFMCLIAGGGNFHALGHRVGEDVNHATTFAVERGRADEAFFRDGRLVAFVKDGIPTIFE